MTNVELPKDAEGREIPLDTKVLYRKDGTLFDVDEFNFSTGYSDPEHKWTVKLMNCAVFFTTKMFLNPPEPPDSWEKLLEDLDNTAEKASGSIFIATPCAWFSDGNRHCADCPADEPPEDTCGVKLIKNIAARIRRLVGDSE